MMSEYEKQAVNFLKRNNIRFSVLRTTVETCEWDNKSHYRHYVRFYNRNTKKSMSVRFFSSLQDFWDMNEKCTAYDVLACIQKYDVGTIDDFVSEFGYSFNTWEDVRKAEKTYRAVVHEYKGVERVFGDCLEELREIA